jgi:hypothetical protein
MSEQPTFDTPPTETESQANAGRDANGVPPVVGLGDGKFVPALSDEDNERLRAIVQQQQPIVRLPDGSIRITFTLPPELAIPLEEWAIGAGEPFESYAQNFLETSLNATILGANVG